MISETAVVNQQRDISMSVTVVCLIACDGGPADHFASYAEVLTKQGCDVQIHATGPALKKFKERDVTVKSSFSLDNLTSEEEDHLAQELAEACSIASIVIIDIGHAFDIKIQKALKSRSKRIPCLVYYDNPEPFVPGGYSSTAAEVMGAAEGVLFANEALAKAKIYSAFGKEIDFTHKNRFGIGYYPVNEAEKIAEKRKSDHEKIRSIFLMKNGIVDKGQKVVVYFGGNNKEYFSKAFPAFLSFLAEASEQGGLKKTVIAIQQHPGAKVNNQDGQQIEAWLKRFGKQAGVPRVILLDFSSGDVLLLADAVLYYQTSMSPQFVLAGIPTVQIGHEIYEDILVRSHLIPTVTSAKELTRVIKTLEKIDEKSQQDLLNRLGIKEDWPKVLDSIIKDYILITRLH